MATAKSSHGGKRVRYSPEQLKLILTNIPPADVEKETGISKQKVSQTRSNHKKRGKTKFSSVSTIEEFRKFQEAGKSSAAKRKQNQQALEDARKNNLVVRDNVLEPGFVTFNLDGLHLSVSRDIKRVVVTKNTVTIDRS
jgi:hypothetical protein